MTVTVADVDGQEVNNQPRTVGNDESKRWRGGRGSSAQVDQRVNACYAYILEGGTRRQVVDRLVQRFNISERTGHDDYAKAQQLLKTEQIATRGDLLNQLQALRLATVRKALAKGQLQTVAMLLKDMGAVIGETVEAEMEAQPSLRIEIADKREQ